MRGEGRPGPGGLLTDQPPAREAARSRPDTRPGPPPRVLRPSPHGAGAPGAGRLQDAVPTYNASAARSAGTHQTRHPATPPSKPTASSLVVNRAQAQPRPAGPGPTPLQRDARRPRPTSARAPRACELPRAQPGRPGRGRGRRTRAASAGRAAARCPGKAPPGGGWGELWGSCRGSSAALAERQSSSTAQPREAPDASASALPRVGEGARPKARAGLLQRASADGLVLCAFNNKMLQTNSSQVFQHLRSQRSREEFCR